MKSRDEIENIRQYGFKVIESTDAGGCGWFRCAPFYKTTVVWTFNDKHVSIHSEYKMPSWDDMCKLKDMFYNYNDEVWQCHPKKSQYVNGSSYSYD